MRPVEFAGKDVFVVGSGPSLIGFDYSLLNGRAVIAVNNAYRFVKHDVHTFYDQSFLKKEAEGYDWRTHPAHVLASVVSGVEPGENRTIYRRASTVTKKIEQGLYVRYSSTQAGVNYALIMGARNVYLLGVDCKFFTAEEVRMCATLNGNPSAADEVLQGMDFAHHVSQQVVRHSMHEKNKQSKYLAAAVQFSAFQPYPVFNCSPCSELSLKYVDIKDALIYT